MEYIIFQSAFFAGAMAASLGYIHMLQLESYQFPGYWRWLKTHADDAAYRLLPALIAVLAALWNARPGLWICSALFLLPPWLGRRKQAKKPLKITARVVRLLVVLALLLAGVSMTARLPWEPYRRVLPAIAYVALPFWVMAANGICLPIQKAVNGRYVRDAKRRLAAHPGLTMIGITGSYGKTSIKGILETLLKTRYNVYATPASYNTPMGVVRAVREGLNATHEVFLCEMGARHPGDVRELCELVPPKYGVITAVGPMHLETFKTIETVARTKLELADALPPDGKAFLCADDSFLRARRGPNTVMFGLEPEHHPDYLALNLSADASGTRFTVRTQDGREQAFTTSLLGKHQVRNLLAGIAAADTLGIPMSKLPPAVRAVAPVPHRLQLIPGGKINLIDDAFNANPAGAKAALEVLGMMDGVRILVTPGMVELGAAQEDENKSFGLQAAAVCDYVALVGEKQTQPIAAGLREAGFPENRLFVGNTLEAAMQWVRAIADERDFYVLLENDLPDNY